MKKIARIIILIIAVITVTSAYITRNIRFNYTIEDYFPKEDPLVESFIEFMDAFSQDNEFIMIGIQNEKGIFHADFLQKVDRLSQELSESPYILSVSSPTRLKDPIISRGGVFQVPVLHSYEPDKLANDSNRIYTGRQKIGSFFSEDAKSLCVYVRNQPNLEIRQADSLLQFVKEKLKVFSQNEVHVMGKIPSQEYYTRQMAKEMITFTLVSFVLLVIFMVGIYRNVWTLGIAITVIGLALLWTVGFVLFVEEELNLMMTLLPILLFVIGISDVVHILTKYIEELRLGKEKVDAIKTTFKEVGLATLLTSVTTAIGFLSLATSNAPPIKFFGIYTSIGVMITYVIAITLLPSILILQKKPEVAKKAGSTSVWNRLLVTLFGFTIRNQKGIIMGSIALVVISAVGITQMRINNFFLEDLSERSALKQDLNFFEDHYAGVRPIELGITVKGDEVDIFDPAVIREINKIEEFVIGNYHSGFTLSYVSILKALHQSTNGGMAEAFRLPESDTELKKLIQKARKFKLFKKGTALIAENEKQVRISTKMRDIGSFEQNKLNQKFNAFVANEVNAELVDINFTGIGFLLDQTNKHISVTLISGLAMAAFVIAIIMAFILKSLKMVAISLIPNLIPLLMIAGLIGFMRYDVKISTAIIFTIAFGICVDDTIHFLSKLRLELSKGKSMMYAVKRTYLSTGKAIILTSVILSSGFMSFLLSDFSTTTYVGFLIGLTLIFAVLADLLLLPVLLLWWMGKRK